MSDVVTVVRTGPAPGIVDTLLRELPEWFGIEEAIVEYVDRSGELPAYVASLGDDPVGVLVIEQHNPAAAEMYVLAVRRRSHRRGVGRALVEAAERDLRADGSQFLQVKTLGEGRPSPEYDDTRRFYEALGYRPLEEFPTDSLWPGNPCLLMVKHLSCGEEG